MDCPLLLLLLFLLLLLLLLADLFDLMEASHFFADEALETIAAETEGGGRSSRTGPHFRVTFKRSSCRDCDVTERQKIRRMGES